MRVANETMRLKNVTMRVKKVIAPRPRPEGLFNES